MQEVEPCRQHAVVNVCIALFAIVPVAAANRPVEAMAGLGMWQLLSAIQSWQEWCAWCHGWDGQMPLQPIQSMSTTLSGLAWCWRTDSSPNKYLLQELGISYQASGNLASQPQSFSAVWTALDDLSLPSGASTERCDCLTAGVVFETSGGWVWYPGHLQWHLKCVWQLNGPYVSYVCCLGTNIYLMK